MGLIATSRGNSRENYRGKFPWDLMTAHGLRSTESVTRTSFSFKRKRTRCWYFSKYVSTNSRDVPRVPAPMPRVPASSRDIPPVPKSVEAAEEKSLPVRGEEYRCELLANGRSSPEAPEAGGPTGVWAHRGGD